MLISLHWLKEEVNISSITFTYKKSLLYCSTWLKFDLRSGGRLIELALYLLSVTISRPPSSSSLKIINRSFRYAPPCLCNQRPASFRQPHPDHSSSGPLISSQLSKLIPPIVTLTTVTGHFLLYSFSLKTRSQLTLSMKSFPVPRSHHRPHPTQLTAFTDSKTDQWFSFSFFPIILLFR